jgi:hypothetical protein
MSHANLLRHALLSICIIWSVALLIIYHWWPDLALGLGAEQAPLAWLQSSVLVAISTLLWLKSISASFAARKGWAILAFILMVAALDERFTFHETVQDYILEFLMGSVGIKSFGHAILERLAQSVTLTYAIAGLMAARWLKLHVSAFSWQWIRVSILIGLCAIGLDIFADSMGTQIVEELLELTAESLFFAGLLIEVSEEFTNRKF